MSAPLLRAAKPRAMRAAEEIEEELEAYLRRHPGAFNDHLGDPKVKVLRLEWARAVREYWKPG